MAENFFLFNNDETNDEDIFSAWLGDNAVPLPVEVQVYGEETEEETEDRALPSPVEVQVYGTCNADGKETEDHALPSPEDDWSMEVNVDSHDMVDWGSPLPDLGGDVLSLISDEPHTTSLGLPQPTGETKACLPQPPVECNISSVFRFPIPTKKHSDPLSPIPEQSEVVAAPLSVTEPYRESEVTRKAAASRCGKRRQPLQPTRNENFPGSEFNVCSRMSPSKKKKLEDRMTNTSKERVVPEATLKSLTKNAWLLSRLCKQITKYGSEIQTIKGNLSVSCMEAECCNATIKALVSKMNYKMNNVTRK